jgi:hypothetical protein
MTAARHWSTPPRLSVENRQITLHVVGEVFDTGNDGMSVFTDAGNLPAGTPVSSIKISVTDVTDAAVYAEGLEDTIRLLGATTAGSATGGSDMAVVLGGLTAALTLMLIVVAGLGVLNTVPARAQRLGDHARLSCLACRLGCPEPDRDSTSSGIADSDLFERCPGCPGVQQ